MLAEAHRKRRDVNTLRPPRILVIEDDQDTAEVLCAFLKMKGYICEIKNDGNDILSFLKQYEPDLIIIDYLLPMVNGGEICSEIKRDQNCSHLPVIIYSAYSRVFLSLGRYHCDAFIEKPFDLDELQLKIEQIIDQFA